MPSPAPAHPPFHIAALTRNQSLAILAGAAIMMSLAMGMRQSLGLFMQPMARDAGLAAADFAFALAIQNIAWGVTQPFAGAIVDRWGTRLVSICGVALFAGGLALTAVVPSAVFACLGMGIMVGVALSCCTSSVTGKITARVVNPHRRGLAFGIMSAAGSLGGFAAAPLAAGTLSSSGWQIGLIAFVGLAAAMLPAALFASRADDLPPDTAASAQQSLKSALGEACGHGGYMVMATAYFVCGLQLAFLVTHLPAFLASCGLEPMVGALALVVIGGFNVIGSLVFGWAGDRLPRQILLGSIYLLRSVAIAVYFSLPVTAGSTMVFAAIMGFLWLGVQPLVQGLVAQIFGIRFLGTLTGVAFFSHQVGAFLGAWGGGVVFAALGSYDVAWKIAVLIGLIAGTVQLLMSKRPLPRMVGAPA